jgi:hypothetical protein
MMVEDLLVEVLDTSICAWVNSKPDFSHYFLCKKSTGIVRAMGFKDARENGDYLLPFLGHGGKCKLFSAIARIQNKPQIVIRCC